MKALRLWLALALLVAAEAQPAAKVPRVAVVATVVGPPWEAFRQALNDLGHVDGRSVTLEWRVYGGRVEQLHEVMADLVLARVDVLVVSGNHAAHSAKDVTSTIPIVACSLGDPSPPGS